MENISNEKAVCLSVSDLAREMGVSRPFAYQLVQSKGFPSFRLGKRVLISREGFDRWIADQTANKRAEA